MYVHSSLKVVSGVCRRALEQTQQCEFKVICLPMSLFSGIFNSGITVGTRKEEEGRSQGRSTFNLQSCNTHH